MDDVENAIERERRRVEFERGLRREPAREEYARILGEVLRGAEDVRKLDCMPSMIGVISTILAFFAMIIGAVWAKILIWILILGAWIVLYLMKQNRQMNVDELIEKMAMTLEVGAFYQLRSSSQERIFNYAKIVIINRPKGVVAALTEFFGRIYDRFYE